jgi:molybdate transport system substrate-binding protein
VKFPRFVPPLVLVFLIFALAACGEAAPSTNTSASTPIATTPAAAPVTLKVFAASSLTESFGTIKTAYHAAHPNVNITYDFDGSQNLETQLANGAPADIFASADEAHMQKAVTAGLVTQSQDFAKNQLVVIVPSSNPGKVTTLQDLSKPGLKLVTGDSSVPIGVYGMQVLDKLGKSAQYGAAYEKSVKADIVSQEDTTKGVVSKVQLGEADAGIVYRTDVTAAVAPKVKVITIPDQYNVIAQYPIAVLKGSTQAQDAQAFITYLLSSEGQSTLAKYNFMPIK